MTIEELNTRFGKAGKIDFRPGFGGFPNVVLACAHGTAEVALLGGNVLSWVPAGRAPVIFRPAKADAEYRRGDPFHGGIPVCWPQFGNRFSKDLPGHGFAKRLVFEVRGSDWSENRTEVTIGLGCDDETRRLWPHAFDLEFKVSVSEGLDLRLTTKNVDDAPFAFSAGFHPYFSVGNRDDVVVKGLDGCTYYAPNVGPDLQPAQKGDFKVDFAPDHVFLLPGSPAHEFSIVDPVLGRTISMTSTGNDRAVVWNVGEAWEELPDFHAGEWPKYVCVEPVSDWPGGRTLHPGESHVLMLRLCEGVARRERL